MQVTRLRWRRGTLRLRSLGRPVRALGVLFVLWAVLFVLWAVLFVLRYVLPYSHVVQVFRNTTDGVASSCCVRLLHLFVVSAWAVLFVLWAIL